MAGKPGGGAWKVAYADFVTAMMALFLMLWISAQDQKIKEAVERAFRNPFMSVTKESTGVLPNKMDAQTTKGKGQGKFDSPSAMELEMLRRLNDELKKVLESNPDYDNETVKLEFTADGLNISVLDRTHKPVFKRDSAEFTDYGKWVFTTLAWEISRYRVFRLELEGHTEAGHRFAGETYDAWDLTTDRANAARRQLVGSGVAPGQVRKVAGFGDTMPMPNEDAESEVNRRVTVMLRIPDGKPS